MREGYASESEEEAKKKNPFHSLHQNISELYRFLTERTRKSRKPPDVSSPKKRRGKFLVSSAKHTRLSKQYKQKHTGNKERTREQ
jgi:hypothetical protein